MSSGHSSMQVAALRGGPPACEFSWPDWPIYDEREEAGLLEVLRSRKWWFGDRVRQFESEFATFQGADFAVTCTNGTTALEMGLRALGVVEGDQVIVPPYSFIATASAVVTIGAIPVFADILGDTLCLDPDDFQRKITPQTKAVVPVHVGPDSCGEVACTLSRVLAQFLEGATSVELFVVLLCVATASAVASIHARSPPSRIAATSGSPAIARTRRGRCCSSG